MRFRQIAPDGETDLVSFDDREDVADADRDVDRHLADRLDLDALAGEHDVGRRPAQGDLAHAIPIGARDRVHDARLRIDDHRRLVAGRWTIPVSIATVAAPIVPSPQDT
jgi:hypothetical protein